MNESKTFRLIFDNTPHCIKILDAQGRLIQMNRSGLDLIDADSLDQVYLHEVIALVHDEDKALFWNAHLAALKGKKSRINFRVHTLKGKLRYMQSDLNPIIEDDGTIEFVLSLTHDVTEEMESRKSLEFQAFLLNNVQQSVIATNLEGEIIYMNKFAEKLYGYTTEELMGKNINILTPDDQIQAAHGVEIMERLANGQSWEGEFSLKRKDGVHIDIHTVSSPLFLNGKQHAIVVVTYDITERKNRQTEHENLTAELAERLVDFKKFGYMISHNMRAPVANLNGLLHILDKAKITDETTLEVLNGLEQSTQNLSNVLSDLIQVLKIKERVKVNREVLLFDTVFRDVRKAVEPILHECGAAINTNFEYAPKVEYDNNYLQSLFFNLITNSIKYRQPQTRPVISIKTERKGDKVVLNYEDNGVGFDLTKVGSKVFGLHQKFHPKTEGRGLGLFLIKTQIESMGGVIELFSEPNKGSKFTVTFN